MVNANLSKRNDIKLTLPEFIETDPQNVGVTLKKKKEVLKKLKIKYWEN